MALLKTNRVLLVCAHRPGRSPSQRYRFEQYLPMLEESGFSFTWSYLLDEKTDRDFYSPGRPLRKAFILLSAFRKRLHDVSRANQFDLIFIQREAFFAGGAFFEKRFYRRRIPIIFDFDDSIWLADTSPGNRKFEFLKRPSKFFDNLRYASVVIAGNEYLAARARRHSKAVIVIPTTIDTSFHAPIASKRGGDTVVIGWSGSVSTLKHFELILPVLRKIGQKYGKSVAFKVMGTTHCDYKGIHVSCAPWSEETEVDTLNSFDIGIMPLPDDEWSKGKCGLKGLSYMACGVATVMSRAGVNTEIIRQGENGLLATNDEEWFECLSRLIEDRTLRERLGEAGRKTVEERFSVSVNAPLYRKAFEAGLSARV